MTEVQPTTFKPVDLPKDRSIESQRKSIEEKGDPAKTIVLPFECGEAKGTTTFYRDSSGQYVGGYQEKQEPNLPDTKTIWQYDTSITNGLAGTEYVSNDGDDKIDFAAQWHNPNFGKNLLDEK